MIYESLAIVSTLLSPLIAVQVTQFLDRRRSAHQRKEQIFKTLMATRGSRLSAAHVEALNAIDIEFYGTDKRSKAVTRAWAAYNDHLYKVAPPEALAIWVARNDQLFIELLQRMAEALDYDFDQTTLSNSAYTPVAHGNAESDQLAIRQGLVKLLRGEVALPVAISITSPSNPGLAAGTTTSATVPTTPDPSLDSPRR